MKKLLFLLAIPLILTSCVESSSSELGKVLQGDHVANTLRLTIDSTKGQQSNYFIVKDKGSVLMFSWTLPDETTVTSSIPMSKVRLKFDPTVEKPIIKFRWRQGGYAGQNWDTIFNDYVTYIVVICKEEDFPFNIPVY